MQFDTKLGCQCQRHMDTFSLPRHDRWSLLGVKRGGGRKRVSAFKTCFFLCEATCIVIVTQLVELLLAMKPGLPVRPWGPRVPGKPCERNETC